MWLKTNLLWSGKADFKVRKNVDRERFHLSTTSLPKVLAIYSPALAEHEEPMPEPQLGRTHPKTTKEISTTLDKTILKILYTFSKI